jgi:hypothetical protein
MQNKNKNKNKTQNDYDLIAEIRKDKLADDVASLIVNRWGINLCSVKSIVINRQPDGQLTDLHVEFIPNPDGDEKWKE